MQRVKFLFSGLLLLSAFYLHGQNGSNDVPINFDNPHNTMLVHLHYLQPETYQPEIAAQSLGKVADSTDAEKLAIQLKQILDGEGLRVIFGRIPQDNNYVDSLSGKAQFTPFPNKRPEIYLEQVGNQWLYSRETVANIPALHRRVYPFGVNTLLNVLPKFAQEKVLGLALWQYLGILIVLLICWLAHFILTRLLDPIVKRLSQSKIYPSLISKRLIRRVARTGSLLLILRLMRLLIPPLQLPIGASAFVMYSLRIASIVLVVILLLRIVQILVTYWEHLTQRTESKLDEQLVPIASRLLQGIVILIGFIQLLNIFNVNVNALIAGLSIGGIALALAAQDTLKNLFGSVMVFLDRPFQVGDWINFGGVDGTVEEVGLRSTRVRTFANSLVYVPNGKLADMVIDNFGLRHYRRFYFKISVTYDTPPMLIEKFVEGLRQLIEEHPRTRKDAYEVHLNEMGSASLNILFYSFFQVNSWSEELRTRHEILIAILELAERLGVRFAFPTQTIHIEDLPGAGSLSPQYEKDAEALQHKLDEYVGQYSSKHHNKNGR